MILAVDVDGVLADLHIEWLRRYNADWEDDITPEKMTEWEIHTLAKGGHAIYDYLQAEDLYAHVPEVAGAREGIAALRALGHEILYVTSCHFKMTDQKAMWLSQHGFLAEDPSHRGLPRELIVANAKHHINAHLLIEDRAETVRRWVEDTHRPAILMERPYNRHLLEDVPSAFWSWCTRVTAWREIVAHVEAQS
jgi:5'(3')-deoxyribonucleotidase